MEMNNPIASIEWEITAQCNYHCSYCSQKNYRKLFNKHCSDKIISSMYSLIDNLPYPWLIKISGGEPFIHPKFLEICEHITKSGHKLCTTTNFSVPIRVLEKFLSLTGNSLEYLVASLHLDEIQDINGFIDKAVHFKKLLSPETKFTVVSVGIESKFELLEKCINYFSASGVNFEIAPLKKGLKYAKYKESDFKKMVEKYSLTNIEKIKGKKSFGKLCHSGELFIRTTVEGDVFRCYSLQPRFYLGNIQTGTFSFLNEAKPCLSSKCICTLPVNRNMIELESSSGFNTIIKEYKEAISENGMQTANFGLNLFNKQVKYLLNLKDK